MRRDRVRWHLPAGLATFALVADSATVLLIVAMVRAGSGPTIDVFTVGGIVLGAAYAMVGWIIASRRPDNRIGWVFLAIGVSQAVDVFASAYSTVGLIVAPGSLPLAAELSWVAVWAWAPGFTLLVTLSVLLFPDGQLPSPRWRPVIWASLAIMALLTVPIAIAAWPLRGDALMGSSDASLGSGADIARSLQGIGILATPFVALASVAGMVVRFRRAGATERQQLKWFTWAAIPEVAFVVSSGFVTIPPFPAIVASVLIAPLLPVAAMLAILRHRLYDIDRIISRTVSYGAVTGIMAVVFVGTILVSQTVLASFFSSNSVAVAASTLVVAGLFQPLRRRVQSVVDRRFDRSRYDTQMATEAFAVQLRDQVDLNTIEQDLAATVNGSLRPLSVGLWVRNVSRGSGA